MPLRLLTTAACAAAILCVAVPASAHHAATVSATAHSLALDPPRCGMSERRHTSRCDGTRVAHVAWSATCGATPFARVDFHATRKDGGRPIPLASEDGGQQTSGTTDTFLEPGAHVYAAVTMDCHWDDPQGTGPEAHTVSVTSAPTEQVVVPPWLREVNVIRSSFCNFNPGFGRELLQARQRGNIVDFGIDYMDRSLLGVSRRKPAGIRQVWVSARGAGIRRRKHPRMFLLQAFGRRQQISGGLDVNPRKPGLLTLSAEVGGVRSNSLAIRVVRSRC